MVTLLEEKQIILGITGSIAAYKAAELASMLTQAGARVDVILTPGAEKFVTPLTFQSVTGRKAFTEGDLWGGEAHVLHVGLGHSADLLILAPCTANTIAKLANGLANNLLTITALAAKCPILIAPAMDAGMYSHPATLNNIATLSERSIQIAGPVEGRMASGLIGLGRMMEPDDLFGHIRMILAQHGPLEGKQMLVTAGGTQEPIDPVRHISNRSSGKQGYALAQAAIDKGASVTLISTPTQLPPPIGVKLIPANTAKEMLNAVLDNLPGKDALVMTAAVADFSPVHSSNQKIKKKDGIPSIQLEATADILATIKSPENKSIRPKVMVGFAAESDDLLKNAKEKLDSKNLDMIVANDISSLDSGFGVDTNRVTLLFADGNQLELPLSSKTDISEAIITHITTLLEKN